MTVSTQIEMERWADFCISFSNGNKGRTVGIEVFSTSSGDNQLVAAAPLMGVDYDPSGKGDDFLLSVGDNAIEFTHRVDTPVELWEAQSEDGEIEALEFIDQQGVKTVLSFAHHT